MLNKFFNMQFWLTHISFTFLVVLLLFPVESFAQENTTPTPIYHTVQPQEGLWGIAQKNNTSVEQLRIWNNLRSNHINVGQRLIVGYQQAEEQSQEKQTNQLDDQQTIAEQRQRQYNEAVSRGDAFFRIGNYAEAKKHYEEAIRISPGNRYPENKILEINRLTQNEEVYNQHVRLGNEAYNTGELHTANAHFTKALEAKPNDRYAIEKRDKIMIEINRAEREQRNTHVQTNKEPAPDRTIRVITPSDEEEKEKKWLKTWWFELAYIQTPISKDDYEFFESGHGLEIQFDFPLRNRKADERFFPSLGLGGGVIRQEHEGYSFPETKSDITLDRLYGNAVFGLRIVSKRFGFSPRIGYNYTWQQNHYFNSRNCPDCDRKIEQEYHRMVCEAYFHIPFSGRRSNYGLLFGARYLYNIDNEEESLLMFKAGLTF